jgi:hypothetical protein
VIRELAWQSRARGLAQEAMEQDRPGCMRELLGPVPESTKGRRAWRLAAGAIEQYRAAYDLHDPERALGPEPRDPAQRAAWQQARAAVERIHGKQRAQQRERQPTRQQSITRSSGGGRDQPDPSRLQTSRPRRPDRAGSERAAG